MNALERDLEELDGYIDRIRTNYSSVQSELDEAHDRISEQEEMLQSLTRTRENASSRLLASVGSLRIMRSSTIHSHVEESQGRPFFARIKSKFVDYKSKNKMEENKSPALMASNTIQTNTTMSSSKTKSMKKSSKHSVNATALLISIKNKNLVIKKLKARLENVTVGLITKTGELKLATSRIESSEYQHMKDMKGKNDTIDVLHKQIMELHSSVLTLEELLETSISDHGYCIFYSIMHFHFLALFLHHLTISFLI